MQLNGCKCTYMKRKKWRRTHITHSHLHSMVRVFVCDVPLFFLSPISFDRFLLFLSLSPVACVQMTTKSMLMQSDYNVTCAIHRFALNKNKFAFLLHICRHIRAARRGRMDMKK